MGAKRDLDAAEDALANAKVAVDADQDKVKLFKQSADREKKAYDANIYSDQQIHSAESDYRQAVLQEQAADKAVRLAKAAILRDLEQAKSDYQSAMVDNQSAHKVLDLLGRPGSDGTIQITSPINGIVVERDVNPGQTVDQSQMMPWQMFTVSSNNVVWVEMDVYEKDISNVALGQTVLIHASSLPKFETTGKVDLVSPVIDPKSHAVKVRAQIPNPGGQLKDGMFVEAAVQVGHGRSAPVAPLAAVQHTEKGDCVFVEQNGKYVCRWVRVGAQQGNYCVLESGVKPGDKVVTQGALFLTEEAKNG